MMNSQIARPRNGTPRIERRELALVRELENSRRANEKLGETNARLARSNQELAQFAYVASHDLQEPLRMVDSYVGLIERRYKGRLDADADEFIGFAVDGTRRMRRLIDDLLGYSRVSNCALEVRQVETGVLVEAVNGTLAEQIVETGAEIDVGPLPSLEADPVRLERLFTNLIGNALKFRTERPPRIRISAKRSGELWEFAVADNGIGIKPEFREKVFEIFTRLHGREHYEGSGIGLSACQRIVELHSGSIWADAAPGGGSVFRFTLPERHEEEPIS